MHRILQRIGRLSLRGPALLVAALAGCTGSAGTIGPIPPGVIRPMDPPAEVAPVPDAGPLRAGFAARDITPRGAVPLWGYYGSIRPDNGSTGVLDPLFARALVLESGGERAAIVALDLGRAPVEEMVARVRERVAGSVGVRHVLLSGSHTHHGPELELAPPDDDPRAPPVRAYYPRLEEALVEAIEAATAALEPARWGWASTPTELNRNRHTTEASEWGPIPRDPELGLIRIEGEGGDPIVTLVSFAAHPTTHPPEDLRFTAEYPGVMLRAVEAARPGPVMFLQGAAGDLQCEIDDDLWGEVDFMQPVGEALAREVLALEPAVEVGPPAGAGIVGVDEELEFETRLPLSTDNGFFQALVRWATTDGADHYFARYAGDRIRPHLSTLVVAGEVAFVCASGELFSDLAVDLRARSPAARTVFVGYCNGHDLYFPTRRAIAERPSGYGSSWLSAWAEAGAGERIIERSLEHIEQALGTVTRR